jgi:hypothetical protein
MKQFTLMLTALALAIVGPIRESQPRAKVKKLVDEAHRHGVRVSVLVWGTTPAQSSEYLARHQEKAVQSLVDYVVANNLDGLDMDDETWRKENAVTGGPNRELVTQFFRRRQERQALAGDCRGPGWDRVDRKGRSSPGADRRPAPQAEPAGSPRPRAPGRLPLGPRRRWRAPFDL